MPLIYRRLIFCLFNSGREKERVLIQCQLRCCLCVLLSGDFMSPVRNSLCLGELGGLTFGHCFSKSSIMSAATCIREMRDFAILWAILGCILGLCACGQSFHCLFLQEKKGERYPCLLYPFLKEKERELLSMLALSFPARERELELLSVPALSSLCKGGGSVFLFLSFFFLSFSRLAFALLGILT